MVNHNKIIHIVVDEKFIMSAYYQFEKLRPSSNLFYVLVNDLSCKLKHVKLNHHFLKIIKKDLIDKLSLFNKNDLVIFHSLDPGFYDVLFALSKEIKTVLFCFGYEIYDDRNFLSANKLLATKTRGIVEIEKISLKNKVKSFLMPYYRIIKPGLDFSKFEIKRKALKRIDFLGSSFPEEFYNVQRMIKQKKKFFNFWYYSLEEIVNVKDTFLESRNNVLIGNSSHASGNHLESFDFLKKIKIDNYTHVVLPLGYGDSDYGKKIVNIGKNVFGEKLVPITEFMEYEDYVQVLKKCSVAIIYAKRQRAIGNILVLLWYGAKVFLSKENTFYHYLKRLEIFVFCIEEYNFSNNFKLLTAEETNQNRKILLDNFNREKLLSKLDQQLKIVFN